MDKFNYIQIFETHLLPLISRDFGEKGYLFQDDNAPVESRVTGEQVILNWRFSSFPTECNSPEQIYIHLIQLVTLFRTYDSTINLAHTLILDS